MTDLAAFIFGFNAETEGGRAGKDCRSQDLENGKARCGDTVIGDVNERWRGDNIKLLMLLLFADYGNERINMHL